jgi:putative DNA primase/helicase
LISLPPVPESGCFEDFHGLPSGAAFAEQLRKEAEEHYGTAGREFLRKLVPNAEELKGPILNAWNDFAKKHCPENAHGQFRRIAQKIGLAAVAGELATMWGITGWEKGEATKAATVMLEGIAQQRGGYGAHEVQAGIRSVRRFIEREMKSRFVDDFSRTFHADTEKLGDILNDAERVAMWERADRKNPAFPMKIAGHIVSIDGERVFAFTKEGWEEACGGAPPNAVARELLRLDFLLPGEGGEGGKHWKGRKVNVSGDGSYSKIDEQSKLLRPGGPVVFSVTRRVCIRDRLLEDLEVE